jgi:tRNA threonylcarbamoyladenosine biosynthesis protein TsaB
MLLLAVDTSGKHGSIALARCESHECSIMETVPLEGGAFSAQLVPQVAALLAKHSLSKHNIDGLAVVAGPGSFTGLRIGLAAVKAFAEILATPIVAVSLLEAIAASGRSQGQVMAALDAGRGQVFAGEYVVHDEGVHLGRERLVTLAELLASAAGYVVVTADQILADAARGAGLTVVEIESPRGEVIARLGWRKIQAGETVSPADLDANYIRRSSEIFSKAGS